MKLYSDSIQMAIYCKGYKCCNNKVNRIILSCHSEILIKAIVKLKWLCLFIGHKFEDNST